ncbi:MAG: tetratricopeptide repeat protein [Thermoplasmata archaeon]|nr:tetratricopeptide repeat protein [Thermoplasmata archaeon]
MDPMEWAKFVIRNRDDRNYVDAYSVFIREARNNNAEAEYCIGLMYARGQGIEKDYPAAISWFQKSYDRGLQSPAYFLGKMHLLGMGTAKNPTKARMYFEAVAAHDARASYELGIMHFTGKDVPRDLVESAKWMRKSAEAGNAEAQFVLGQFYKAGAGVHKDVPEAVKWLTSAAINRHKGAQILLGNMYRTGDEVGVDMAESDRWYDMADGKSNVEAVKKRVRSERAPLADPPDPAGTTRRRAMTRP